MGTKKDPRIDAYIGKAAPFAQPLLKRLRKVAHAACPEAVESIKWSMPAFLYRGKILCGMAAFKAHATFGFWHQGMEKLLAQELGRTMEAMGLMGRISSSADLPDDATLLRFIRTAVRLHDAGLPSRPKRKPKPALPVPTDLAAALQRNKKAGEAWAKFSPSARRDYLEWITEAKRPETRELRLVTTIGWVAEGKRRNWKYEAC